MYRTGKFSCWKLAIQGYAENWKGAKFLSHRLFPSSRYSIWLDSKLRLVADPMLIIEYFLWRAGSEYAISNHCTRHCVWEEDCECRALARLFHHRELSSPPVP